MTNPNQAPINSSPHKHPEHTQPSTFTEHKWTTAEEVNRLTNKIDAIWKEEKHRRNIFWGWFIALIVIDIIFGVIFLFTRPQPTTSSPQDSSSYSEDYDDDDDSDDSSF